MLERKFVPASAIEIRDGSEIMGYASVFGRLDQGGDVVEKGAYQASLERMTERGGRVKMLWQHEPREPIGIWDEVREDASGLWVKGRILTEVARGREAVALLDAGAIDGLSIGYRTIRARKGDTGRRHLTELDLWEVSLVTFPMLTEARVSGKERDFAGERQMRDLAAAFRQASANIANRTARSSSKTEQDR